VLLRIRLRAKVDAEKKRCPADIWDWYDRGTVRTAALLNLQSPEVRERIKAAMIKDAARFATSDGVLVPNHAIMHVARKP
jgi:hypothetical protein